MCQKEVRKRGIKRLYSIDDARKRACQIASEYYDNLEYFRTKDPYLNLNYYEECQGNVIDSRGVQLSKPGFRKYRQAVVDRTVIDYVNSIIGTYKFIPWVKDDKNFTGIYLPYAVMKSEKARIINILCSKEFSPYWLGKGLWFRDALPPLIASHPSMYSKWFIPLLEKEMIDESIIEEANKHTTRYLSQLLKFEN